MYEILIRQMEFAIDMLEDENKKLKALVMYWRKRCEDLAEDKLKLYKDNTPE